MNSLDIKGMAKMIALLVGVPLVSFIIGGLLTGTIVYWFMKI